MNKSRKNKNKFVSNAKNQDLESNPNSQPSTSKKDQPETSCSLKRRKAGDHDSLPNNWPNSKKQPNTKGKGKKRQRNRRNKKSYNESTSIRSGTCSSVESSTNQSDIPGYYYDSEKKRYFKIMDHAVISSAVTLETIAKAKNEKKRLSDIQTLKERKFSDSVSSLTNLLFSSRKGDIHQLSLKRMLLHQHVKNLKLIDSVPFIEDPYHRHDKVEHMLKMITCPEQDKILCLWSMKETIMQRLQLVHLKEKPRSSENQRLSLGVELSGTTVLQSWKKITNVCWAPFPNYPEKQNVLYTTNCHSTGQAFVFIRDLSTTPTNNMSYFDFNIGNQATWTCAWNKNTERFSVGAEKTCLLIDVETRRLWELNTLNSDPYAQIFSSSHLLYNGTKKGQIVTHDTRSSSTRPIRCLSHKSSISHLTLSNNDIYLYASDYTGQLKVWDTRKNCVVMQYLGLYNEYKRIPFHIDETNSIIYAVGQDGYTKIWCLKSAKLLLDLPPPCLTALDTIPAVQFSTRWANRPGNSGLLMGLNDRLYLYSS